MTTKYIVYMYEGQQKRTSQTVSLPTGSSVRDVINKALTVTPMRWKKWLAYHYPGPASSGTQQSNLDPDGECPTEVHVGRDPRSKGSNKVEASVKSTTSGKAGGSPSPAGKGTSPGNTDGNLLRFFKPASRISTSGEQVPGEVAQPAYPDSVSDHTVPMVTGSESEGSDSDSDDYEDKMEVEEHVDLPSGGGMMPGAWSNPGPGSNAGDVHDSDPDPFVGFEHILDKIDTEDMPEGPAKFVLVTPMTEELDYLMSFIKEQRNEYPALHLRIARAERFIIVRKQGESEIWMVIACAVVMGNGAAQLVTNSAITHFKPEWCILLGIAASIDINKAGVGSVVIASGVTNYSLQGIQDGVTPGKKLIKIFRVLSAPALRGDQSDDQLERLLKDVEPLFSRLKEILNAIEDLERRAVSRLESLQHFGANNGAAEEALSKLCANQRDTLSLALEFKPDTAEPTGHGEFSIHCALKQEQWRQQCKSKMPNLDQLPEPCKALVAVKLVNKQRLACGEAVVKSIPYQESIKAHVGENHVALAMEDYGFLLAAKAIKSVVVRGISDNAGPEKKELDKVKTPISIREWAVHNAARLVFSFCLEQK